MALILTLFFAACDCAYDYTYSVANESSSTIHIKWQQDGMAADSMDVPPNRMLRLFETIHGIEPCHEGHIFQDVDVMLVSISITKDDSIATKLDFRENEQWEYEEGRYRAVVSDDSF